MTDKERKIVEACARLDKNCVHEWKYQGVARMGGGGSSVCKKCGKKYLGYSEPLAVDNPIDLGSVDAALAFAERHECRWWIETLTIGKWYASGVIVKNGPNSREHGETPAVAIYRVVLAAKGVEV